MNHIYNYLKNITGLFDSHAHVNSSYTKEETLYLLIQRSKDCGISHIFDISTNIESTKQSISLSKKSNGYISSFVGIDPEYSIPGSELFKEINLTLREVEELQDTLDKYITINKEYISGIGETGIDNYWIQQKGLSESDSKASIKSQSLLFQMHLDLAKKHDLPVSIHSRAAEEMCIRVVRNHSAVGIFHSFTGNYETAKKVVDLGWGLGINGIITFKNAEELRNTYKKLLGKVSLDWSPEDFYKKGIFFETDSPYLAPEPHRGEKNEPAFLKNIFDYVVSNF